MINRQTNWITVNGLQTGKMEYKLGVRVEKEYQSLKTNDSMIYLLMCASMAVREQRI